MNLGFHTSVGSPKLNPKEAVFCLLGFLFFWLVGWFFWLVFGLVFAFLKRISSDGHFYFKLIIHSSHGGGESQALGALQILRFPLFPCYLFSLTD